MENTVYIGMSADLIHPGHLNVINEGRKLGRVIIGLLTDRAIASYKRVPYLNFDQRKSVIENIVGISEVIAQGELDYTANLVKIKPRYVVHGDDWQTGVQQLTRQKVINTLKEWGGELIEVKYTEGISSTLIQNSLRQIGVTPQNRLLRLQRILEAKSCMTLMEAHDGLSGLIVENTFYKDDAGKKNEFDAIWVSRKTDTLAKGKSQAEEVDFTSSLQTLNEILEVTTKPVIFDGGTGGKAEHMAYTIRSLERLGVSAIVIKEEMIATTDESAAEQSLHRQESVSLFCAKITAARKASITGHFMIMVNMPVALSVTGPENAVDLAKIYIEAGADGIMIDGAAADANEVFAFCSQYGRLNNKVPLLAGIQPGVVATVSELQQAGINMAIYTSHLLCSAFPAMNRTALSVLQYGGGRETENGLIAIEKLEQFTRQHNSET